MLSSGVENGDLWSFHVWPNFAGPPDPNAPSIVALAAPIGLASGVLVIESATSPRQSPWFRAVAGLALMACLAGLVAARPKAAVALSGCWLVAAGWMAAVDLAVVCLLDPHRPRRRFAPGDEGRTLVGLAVVVAVASMILMACFPPLLFLLLQMIFFAPRVGATALVVVVIVPFGVDSIARSVAISLGSKPPPARSDDSGPSGPVVGVAPDVSDAGSISPRA